MKLLLENINHRCQYVYMRTVVIRKPKNNSLVAQLIALDEAFAGAQSSEELQFDLSALNFCFPLLILPISAYINDARSGFVVSRDCQIKSYLDTVGFPGGIDSVTEFNAKIQADKTYVPISRLKRDRGVERERLETQFLKKIEQVVSDVPVATNALCYPVTELVGNIFEHSKKDEGYIFAQFYPKVNSLDICIVDCGRGLARAYKDEKGLNLTDEQAIAEALKGNSTKSNIERGYGVRTSKRVVCEGLGGEFVMVSGSSAFVAKNGDQFAADLQNINWRGVIIAYRIPRPTGSIDISP
ncbi:MAG: hypothetical protein A3D92_17460, partial [Bacteroidetes bacterium RIFCSPHIGHO2_02_FULL_44_7]